MCSERAAQTVIAASDLHGLVLDVVVGLLSDALLSL